MKIIEYILFFYLFAAAIAYAVINLRALLAARHYTQYETVDQLHRVYSDFAVPVSLILPVHNAQDKIVDAVKAILQIQYAEYEVLVVNDGSGDNTVQTLIDAFDLYEVREVNEARLTTQPIRAVYRSRTQTNLRVIDKELGRKADSLNAGLVWSRCPLFCNVDIDTVLDSTSLHRLAQPFVEDPTVVAAGAAVRIANGSEISGGHINLSSHSRRASQARMHLPQSPLVMLQSVQYLRDFLAGRLGGASQPIVMLSGTFTVYRKEAVLNAGGFRSDARNAETELVLRLHRILRASGEKYRIVFIPYPICWITVPEELPEIKKLFVRRHHELVQSLRLNRDVFTNSATAQSWAALAFIFLFEFATPFIAVAGLLLMLIGAVIGAVAWQALLLMLALSLAIGIAQSLNALLIEQLTFPAYPDKASVLRLIGFAILENLGYRQLIGLWRMQAIILGPQERRAR